MKKILALAIVIIMTLSITACSSNTDNQVSEEPTVDEPVVEQSMVDAFIEKYNEIATTPITDVVEVDITDSASGHYRTEFRLDAFKESIAKTGKIGVVPASFIP